MLIKLQTLDMGIIAVETSDISTMYPSSEAANNTTIRLKCGSRFRLPNELNYYFDKIRDLNAMRVWTDDAGLEVY